MTTAGQVAIELRKLADALDKEPETLVKKPILYIHHWDEKDAFLSIVSLLPRPLKKSVSNGSYPRLRIESVTNALNVDVTILQEKMCELVEPAKPAIYKCAPLLSLEEESSLTTGGDHAQ